MICVGPFQLRGLHDSNTFMTCLSVVHGTSSQGRRHKDSPLPSWTSRPLSSTLSSLIQHQDGSAQMGSWWNVHQQMDSQKLFEA